MVIQRWQSVLLFLAAVLTGIFCVCPFGRLTFNDGVVMQLTPAYNTVYLILNIFISLLLFVTIFLYKNLKLQIKVTLCAIVLLVASLVVGIIMPLLAHAIPSHMLVGGLWLVVLAAVLAVAARRLMKKDYRRLHYADRIRG